MNWISWLQTNLAALLCTFRRVSIRISMVSIYFLVPWFPAAGCTLWLDDGSILVLFDWPVLEHWLIFNWWNVRFLPLVNGSRKLNMYVQDMNFTVSFFLHTSKNCAYTQTSRRYINFLFELLFIGLSKILAFVVVGFFSYKAKKCQIEVHGLTIQSGQPGIREWYTVETMGHQIFCSDL